MRYVSRAKETIVTHPASKLRREIEKDGVTRSAKGTTPASCTESCGCMGTGIDQRRPAALGNRSPEHDYEPPRGAASMIVGRVYSAPGTASVAV